MRQGFCAHLSARPAFLLAPELPYDDLLKSPESFAEVPWSLVWMCCRKC